MVQVSADSYNEEGKKLIGRGKFAKAIELFQQAINLEPSYIKAYNNLGAAFKLQNKLKEAEVAYRQAISIQPNYAKAYYNLGVVLKQQQKLSEAEVAYRQAIVCQADFWQAKLELATLLGQQQRLTESESLYLQLTQLKPNYAAIYAQLGSVLYQQNKSCRAVQCYERAIALEPDNASYYNNLGLIFEAQQDRERATLYFEQALRLEPNLAASIQNLGLLSAKQGDNVKAIKLLRQAVEQNTQSHDLHSSLIFMLSNTEGITSEEILQEVKTWCDRHIISAGLKPMSHDNELSSQRRLKIGYVSPDFRRHSVSYFMQPLLASHNRDQVEVFCYSNMPRENEDEVTETIQTLTDHWRNIAQMNPYQVAQQIQADKIDILVDLAGHTKGNSLIAFGLKMAPIQATYLGYYGTTGLSTIDYWITDQVLHPADTKEQSVEQIWRLPRCYVTYQPLADSPQVKPSPVLTNKFVTFGSFNNISKLSDTTIQLWAKILRAVPNARLLLKSLFIQDIDKQSSILAKFAEYGLEKQRIKFCPRQSLIKHLAMYGEIDICLDPFPYNGCTSTCEAMWMGVPVLTLAGERKISRMGSSLLTAVGLTDWIADNKEEYIAKAQEFASKPQKLNDLRQSLRTKFQNSSLFDSQGLAEAMDASYRRMWLKYLEEKIDSTHREVNQRNKVNSDSIQDKNLLKTPINFSKPKKNLGEPEIQQSSSQISPVTLAMKDGVKISVPDSLTNMTTYVLLEQADWFEQEIDFVRHLIKPGMTVIDIGANHGVYSLAMAKALKQGGRVIAYEPAKSLMPYLQASITANQFEDVIEISNLALSNHTGEALLYLNDCSELNSLQANHPQQSNQIVSVSTLDAEKYHHNWQAIDFVKLDAEGEEIKILAGGKKFFSHYSPLVMFEICHSRNLNYDLINSFQELGYEIYRLIPSLQVLVPWENNTLTPENLNLFACKPNRAQSLIRQNLLVKEQAKLPEINSATYWWEYISQLKFSASWLVNWQNLFNKNEGNNYLTGLSYYGLSRQINLPIKTRITALNQAFNYLQMATIEQDSFPRLITLARVAAELGKKQISLTILTDIFQAMVNKIEVTIDEPFLPITEQYDEILIEGNYADWLLVSILETYEKMRCYSAFFSPQLSVAILNNIVDKPFCSPTSKTRLNLAQQLLNHYQS